MHLVQSSHKRAIDAIYPIIRVIGFSLRAIEHLLRQNRLIPNTNGFGDLAEPVPQIIVHNWNGAAAKLVLQAIAFHHLFIRVIGVIYHQCEFYRKIKESTAYRELLTDLENAVGGWLPKKLVNTYKKPHKGTSQKR